MRVKQYVYARASHGIRQIALVTVETGLLFSRKQLRRTRSRRTSERIWISRFRLFSLSRDTTTKGRSLDAFSDTVMSRLRNGER